MNRACSKDQGNEPAQGYKWWYAYESINATSGENF